MKILFALTYYRPHISGLTVYVQRLAEGLAMRGHQVTVVTSQHKGDLPLAEVLNGVRIVRVPVAFSVSKGAIMPAYAAAAMTLVRQHDVVAVNLPNTPIEVLTLAPLARFVLRRPLIMTYHCDVQLPHGALNRLVDELVFLSNNVGAVLADRVVAYTVDYASHSRLLRHYAKKRVVIPPPVEMPVPTAEQVESFRRRFDLHNKRVVGFVARFATEKGIEYALGAIPIILKAVPDVVILFAGEYKHVIGEEAYWERLQPLLVQYDRHWTFTGVLDPTDAGQLASFYAACDATILPSINGTESFGLVQVESMLCGTPVVASNLPGVRQPILTTGMGRVVPIKDSNALAEAVVDVLGDGNRFKRSRQDVASLYSTERTVNEYEKLFAELASRIMVSPGRAHIDSKLRGLLAMMSVLVAVAGLVKMTSVGTRRGDVDRRHRR